MLELSKNKTVIDIDLKFRQSKTNKTYIFDKKTAF